MCTHTCRACTHTHMHVHAKTHACMHACTHNYAPVMIQILCLGLSQVLSQCVKEGTQQLKGHPSEKQTEASQGRP